MIARVAGHDGSILAELLLAKGYEVMIRRSSSISTHRIHGNYQDAHNGRTAYPRSSPTGTP